MTKVYNGERTFLSPIFGWLERILYKVGRIDPSQEMNWKQYGVAMLMFSLASTIAVYAIQRLQYFLPANPQGLAAPSEHLSFNTAVSFATNTNWQSYGGETTLSYLTQMIGLTVQNFVSAAVGMALAIVLMSSVFARPGTPVMIECPPTRREVNTCSTTLSCPTISLRISPRIFSWAFFSFSRTATSVSTVSRLVETAAASEFGFIGFV